MQRTAADPRQQAIGWLVGSAFLAFLIPSLFVGWLELPRRLYLIPFVLAAGGWCVAYLITMEFRWRSYLVDHWQAGLLGATIVGALMVGHVLMQPGSPAPSGFQRVLDIFWLGLAYGAVDALLLTVLPVHAALSLFTHRGAKTMPALAALAASLLVTAAYHLGYPEFRGVAVIGAMLGNAVFTLAMLLTRSPLAPIASHAAMHIAAVLHGYNTTFQLPPHY
jgi:hypothetical protein